MIRLLMRLYPAAWRRRYGDELAELVDQTGLDVPTMLDVVRGAMRERGRALRASVTGGDVMVIGPAWRHPTAWALAALAIVAPTMLFVTISMLAYQLGFVSLQGVMEPVTAWLDGRRIVDLLLVVAPLVALVAAIAPLLRVELRQREEARELVLAMRMRALNLAIGLVAIAIGGLLAWHILVESVMRLGG